MDNFKQIRYITENYNALQGLKQVPLGVCMVLVGMLSVASDTGVVEGWSIVVGMVILSGLGFAAQNVITDRYEDTYGSVESRKTSIPDMAWTSLAVIFTLVEIIATPPFAPTMLVIAAYFAYRWQEANGLLPHYLGLAVVAALGTAAPLIYAEGRIALLLILVGGLLAVGGLLDHRLLTQALHKPEDHD